MSHTISVRLNAELYDNLTAVASVMGERLSDVVRDMLREQAEVVLSSPDFQQKLAERQAALARLSAYAAAVAPTDDDVAHDFTSNGTAPDLTSLVP